MEYRKPSKMNNKGFTLVELIVVLVILAILAALLVPALLGYIDRARKQQYILNAKNLMTATQAELVELYAKSGGNPAVDKSIIQGYNYFGTKNGDCDIINSDFAKKVLETADLTGENEPYCYMFAVGSNYKTTAKVTNYDKYTVYYALYIEKEGAKALYYYNGDWSDANPRKHNSSDIFTEYNVVNVGSWKGKKVQYYLITNHSGKNFKTADFWDWVKEVKK